MISISAALFERLVSWGQYMHWADLQFKAFQKGQSTNRSIEIAVGTAAHWLAAEYVVLEGWMQLGIDSRRVSTLLDRYPEHRDLLRRCRNAVYHFQPKPLDARIAAVLRNESEELSWAIALHFELQGVLLRFSDSLRFAGPYSRELSGILASSIGWFPSHPLADKADGVERLCLEFENMVGEVQSEAGEAAFAAIDAVRDQFKVLDMYPVTSALRQFQGHKS